MPDGLRNREIPQLGVEEALLREALDGRHFDRVLDLGCGSGRMFPVLADSAASYVGVDRAREPLDTARLLLSGKPGLTLVRCDASSLPFGDVSFSAVLSIRMYHRLSNPKATLGELYRVLRPGGILVLAVVPRPTLSTLIRDVWTGVHQPRLHASASFTLRSRVRVTSGQNPGWVETLTLTRTRLKDQGFRIVREIGYGFEEMPMLRTLPSSLWIRLGAEFRRPAYFPNVFIVAERP